MTAEVVTLLPYNASAQERALEAATARIADVPVRVREMWNPDTCPAAQLPWLAWAMSVDVWDPAWTDAQKRGAIKASWAVHRRKGTAGAVRDALQALGFGTKVIEWFQQTPAGAPYTFQVDAEFVDVPLTMAALDQVVAIAESTKNVRSHLTKIRGIARTNGDIFVGVANFGGETGEIQPYQITEISGSGPFHVGAAVVSFELVDVFPEAA